MLSQEENEMLTRGAGHAVRRADAALLAPCCGHGAA